ncbi:MAG: phosphoribosyltransferase [Gammaproteobacteria bacterium SG8_47]|nr:MAG: phosphoribosyltransferase [Gammaproteobacteria bacterium SG8_47]
MSTPPRCTLVSWSTVYSLSRQLARTIKASGFRPELVIAVGRGGYAPARIVCDFLHVTDLTSIRVEHYTATEKQSEVIIRYPLRADIRGRRVLIVDDVNDSGDTLQALADYLATFQPGSLRTGVLHEKSTTTFAVDFVARRTRAWRWIIYPWAVIEDLGAFVAQMSPRPTNLSDARQRLHELYGIRVSQQTMVDVFEFTDDTSPDE